MASGLFEVVEVREFDWEVDYSADEYLDLLNTFSDHLAMPAQRRDRLYAEIRRRILARPSGTVRRGWGAVLHVARRTDQWPIARCPGCPSAPLDVGWFR